MKRFYKIVAKLLIIALLFANQGMMIFADSVEETVEETTIEEITEESVDMIEKYVPDETLESESEEIEGNIKEESEAEPEEELEEEPIEYIFEEAEESEIASDSEIEESAEIIEEEEETVVASSSEISEVDDEVIASSSEIEENVETVVDENDPLGLVATNLFGGSPGVNETITLKFGNLPRFDKSTNWAGKDTGIAKFTAGIDNSYSITGTCGSAVATFFDSTNAPKRTVGSKDHVELPLYDTGDNAVWSGYKFAGWKDNSDNDLGETFFYSFQYGETGAATNDIDYLPQWTSIANPHTVKIRYWRSTSSVATTTNAYKFTEVTKNCNHGEYLLVDPANIQGYKPASYIIKDELGNVVEDVGGLTNRGLKEKDAYGVYYIKDSATDVKMTSDFILQGSMPNHNIEIEFFYIPDINVTNDFTIYYKNALGNDIKDPYITSYKAEQEVTAVPDFVIPNYNYKNAVVTCGTSTADCRYPLGTFYLPGQILSPTDNTDTTADKGKFYAYMPNQEVTVTYTYEAGSASQDIVVNIGTQSVTGAITTMSYIIPDVPVTGTYAPGQEWIVVNHEDKGFGSPIIDTRGVAIESYEGYSSSPRSDGVLKYKLDDFGIHEIDITYLCDFTKDFWTKITFNAKAVADGGHGTIAASAGARPLSERFFEKGKEYNVSDLIAGVDAIPDSHYEVKWYECTTSMEPTGEPYNLSTDKITLSASSFAFFVAFEEIAADFIDILYTNAEHCTLDGIMSTHILKGTAKGNIASPSVIVDAGYKWEGGILVDVVANKYEGGIWNDETEVAMQNIVNDGGTYHPSIVMDVPAYPGAVKPISKFSFESNGFGKVVPFGTYADRVYVLADADDKVVEKKDGNLALLNGFTNLLPGHTYHLYECLSSAAIPDVGGVISSSGSGTTATISGKFIINVPALDGNYTNTDSSITVTARSGMQYALLNPNKTVAKNWGEAFTGLTDTTYYTVVARKSTDTYAADSAMAIENGVPVFMDTHDLTGRTYRLIVLGSNQNITVNGSGKTGQNTSSGPTGKVFKVNAGDTIKLEGSSGKMWEVVSNNVTLSSYTGTRPEFTMPNEDVVVRNFTKIADTANYSIEVINGQHKMGLADKETYAAFLQTDINASTQAGYGLKVKHYVVMNKKGAASTTEGVVNEYNLEVGMTIQGAPYPYGITALDSSKLNTYIVYEKEIQGNIGYGLVSGTITYPYSESDDKLKGSGIITLESAKKFKYTKIQKVTVTSNTDTTYNKDFYVNNNALLNTATNYTSDLEGKLANYWIPNTNTSGNTFNDKEYLYEGTKDASSNVFFATATNVKKDIAVKFYHSLNQAREDEKILLNNELSAADTKLTTLTSSIAIASLTNAINTANTVKVNQRNKSVDELHAAYLVLKEAVDTAADPPVPPGTTITIAINGNGGTTNVTEIYETIGNQYTELSTVTASRDGFTFNRWSTTADGSGQTITPDMTVSDTAYPTELFAIWSQNVAPTPVRRFSGGGSGGGGGGGGGRNHVESNYSTLPVLEQNHNFRSFEKNISNTVFGNSLYFKDNDHYQTYFAYDPIKNSYTLSVINKGTAEKVKNQWATVGKTINGIEVTCAYSFDENGNARTGFYTEGQDVYYFNRAMGEEYASLQLGWVFDPYLQKYYYANPYSGALCVGWTNIDGKDYYFTDTKSLDATGNLNINNETAMTGYGQMLSNCVTPDGYRVDATGARIIEQPH